MGFSLRKLNPIRAAKKAVKTVVKVITKAISWIIPTPDIPDFGVNEFDDFEQGILVNKQSNDAAIPIVYGERLLGGTRIFLSTSGTDNEFLYMALVLCEGEINAITEIKVDDKVVTFTGAMAEIKQSDIDLMKTRGGKLLDYDTFKTISGNDSLTPAEHAQLKATV